MRYINYLKDKLFWLHGYENGIQEEWFRKYQENARIYLDEYSEQEKLREEYFNHKNYFENSVIKVFSFLSTLQEFYNACTKYCILDIDNSKDLYFENRWLRRQ